MDNQITDGFLMIPDRGTVRFECYTMMPPAELVYKMLDAYPNDPFHFIVRSRSFLLLTKEELMHFVNTMTIPHFTLWLPPATDEGLLVEVAKNIMGALLLLSNTTQDKVILAATNMRPLSRLTFHRRVSFENVKVAARNMNSFAILAVERIYTSDQLKELAGIIKPGSGFLLNRYTPEDNDKLKTIAENMNDGAMFLLPSIIDESQLIIFANSMKARSILVLTGELKLETLIKVANNMNAGSIFLPPSEISPDDLAKVASNMKRDSILTLPIAISQIAKKHTLSVNINIGPLVIAAAKNMPPFATLLLDSEITYTWLIDAAKHMNTGSILSFRSDINESKLKLAASNMKDGSILSLRSDINESKLKLAASNMKDGSIFSPPSDIDANTLKDIVKNIANDVSLLILPTTDEKKLDILRELTEAKNFLFPPNTNENESEINAAAILIELASANHNQEDLKIPFWSKENQTPLLFRPKKTECTTDNERRRIRPRVFGEFHQS